MTKPSINADDLNTLIAAQDAIWMAALGFTLVTGIRTVTGGKIWKNEKLGFNINATKAIDIASVVRMVLYTSERKAVDDSQRALRDALLPAMGLTTRDVNVTEDGWERTIASNVVQID